MAGEWNVKTVVREFFGVFRELPDRASGTYPEQKTASMLRGFCPALFDVDVKFMPFAVDLSSGSWNVCLHSYMFFLSSAGIFVLGKIMLAYTSFPSPWQTVTFSFLGEAPAFFTIISIFFCGGIVASRILSTYTGWSFFSFFIPNAESGNVICSTRKEKEPAARKLVILTAHYDSGRCLPSVGGKNVGSSLLAKIVKNGLSLGPMLAACLITFTLFVHLVFGLRGAFSVILVILSLLSVIFILVETVISNISANMPFNPGYNDNLSGAAVLAGCMETICPSPVKAHWTVTDALKDNLSGVERKSTAFSNTDFEFVFTGSEENGLMGAVEYRKKVLKQHLDAYGKDNVYIVNLDSISGKYIKFFNREKDFAGMNRGGNDKFIEKAETFINGKNFSEVELLKYFSPEEIERYFTKDNSSYKMNLIRSVTPIQACTDMSSLVYLFDKTLNIITLVSRETNDKDDIGMPRDYHSLTDTYEKMVEEDNGYNLTPVIFTVFAINNLLKYLDEMN
ncbi:MAG: hypothetical protein A2231_05880 [Candidatus Firestonebacteria bacterium RIFOXYA2_FULL_40_8]|nr:MAG: hypothetical protein A2231_05880 [Candidatus Firestonebacteria bacterium RIFOXYA2_FULL_40_8]